MFCAINILCVWSYGELHNLYEWWALTPFFFVLFAHIYDITTTTSSVFAESRWMLSVHHFILPLALHTHLCLLLCTSNFISKWSGFILKRCQNHFICYALMKSIHDVKSIIFLALFLILSLLYPLPVYLKHFITRDVWCSLRLNANNDHIILWDWCKKCGS